MHALARTKANTHTDTSHTALYGMNTHYLVTYQWHPVVFVIAQGRSSRGCKREGEQEREVKLKALAGLNFSSKVKAKVRLEHDNA